MALNDAGRMVHGVLADLDVWYPGVHIDVFQVMPDHVHAIVWLSCDGSPSHAMTTPSSATTPHATATPVGAGPRARPSLRAIEPRLGCDASVRSEFHRDTRCDVPHMDIDAMGVCGSCTTGRCATRQRNGAGGVASRGRARGPAPTGVVAHPYTLGDIVHRFKSLTTARYRHGVARDGWPEFCSRLWQRNYYERIVRDQAALDAIRRYIRNNPRNWGAPRQR